MSHVRANLTIPACMLLLAGCQLDLDRPEPGVFSAEPKLTGTHEIVAGTDRKVVSWYTWEADYNAIQAGTVWKQLKCPPGTVSAYAGTYGTIQWCEFEDNGSCSMFIAQGIDFIALFSKQPGPEHPEIRVRNWLFGEPRGDAPKPFRKRGLYVFCFDANPVSDGRSKLPAVDFWDMLPRLAAIIEVVPTYDYSCRSPSATLHLMPQDLVTYEYRRAWGPWWSLTRQPDGSMRLATEAGTTALAQAGLVQRLLYALNTMEFHRLEAPHVFKSEPVSRTAIVWRQDGKERHAALEHGNGGWYFTDDRGNHFVTPYPNLLHEVEEEARSAAHARPL